MISGKLLQISLHIQYSIPPCEMSSGCSVNKMDMHKPFTKCLQIISRSFSCQCHWNCIDHSSNTVMFQFSQHLSQRRQIVYQITLISAQHFQSKSNTMYLRQFCQIINSISGPLPRFFMITLIEKSISCCYQHFICTKLRRSPYIIFKKFQASSSCCL